ncbi:Anhydro-N-acetylmuramic acid kinase [Frankliniella fusca]|uniref:Anhydro-N-acetylmuramic acid kinase n=1 Tax=Frankliniella fusca TaxID=407009 RepID=A0AAE1LFH6_9NEOP|nr:Anhydro-N-acetylmuramic acid kinase [Frankliniella fusca]
MNADEIDNVAAILLEQQLEEMMAEMDMLALVAGQWGARIMGAIEDGFDIDAEELNEENWVFLTVNAEEYRIMGDPSFRMHFRMKKNTFEASIFLG